MTSEFAHWATSHRIIRTIYPPVDLFEDIADPADWELLTAAEAKTNPRIRDASRKPVAGACCAPGQRADGVTGHGGFHAHLS